MKKTIRIRGYEDSSIIVERTRKGLRIEILVKGGKSYCHLSKEKGIELLGFLEENLKLELGDKNEDKDI